MSRKSSVALVIWIMLAAACGGDDPAPAPTDTSGRTEVTETTSGTDTTGTSLTTEGATEATVAGTGAVATTVGGTTATGLTTETGDTATTGDTTETSEETVAGTSSTTETSAGPATTAYSGPVSPITGLPVDDPALVDRKLVAVKIDNHWDARPQSGLEQAEAVYEVVVESGILRFIGLFHHSDSDWVGPMRSLRPTDWTLVKPLNGVLAISGGQPWITRLVTRNGVPLIGDYGPPLTARWRERNAPHNLYVNTYEVRRIAADRGLNQEPPAPLFKRGPLSGPAEATATYIFFEWSDTSDVVWRWDGSRYLRSVDGKSQLWRTREGETGQISADVLIVLMAEGYRACPQGEGSCVPAWDTVGENRAIVFGEGRYAEGRWRRASAGEWFTITDAGGAEITVPPGRMWIMIYPETSDLVW